MYRGKKIAIVYDWIDKWGGVERVLLAINKIFPEADFFTSYYDSEKAIWAKNLKIKTSFIQTFPQFIRKNRLASFVFYPYAFESFDFSTYDLVISLTSSFAKSIITRPETLHICYLLTPTRYLWSGFEDYFDSPFKRTIVSPYIRKLREWDFVVAQRPDKIIALSQVVARRCKKYYQREATVIYPPFDTQYWQKIQEEKMKISKRGSYFLVVSRLEAYKKVETVVRLFNRLTNLNLIIAGEGGQSDKLKKIARDNVLFLNKITDGELGTLYKNAEALIMPQEEDFGYVALEAQFFGCPVIAYHKGGATETVVDGKTGIFFGEQSEESLQSAINRFFMIKYNLKKIVSELGPENFAKFSSQQFKENFLATL